MIASVRMPITDIGSPRGCGKKGFDFVHDRELRLDERCLRGQLQIHDQTEPPIRLEEQRR
jgi:hypothetical protein